MQAPLNIEVPGRMPLSKAHLPPCEAQVPKCRRKAGRKFYLRASATTDKVRVDTGFLTATASTGEEGHGFLRSSERRLHYRGDSFSYFVMS